MKIGKYANFMKQYNWIYKLYTRTFCSESHELENFKENTQHAKAFLHVIVYYTDSTEKGTLKMRDSTNLKMTFSNSVDPDETLQNLIRVYIVWELNTEIS